MCDPISIAGLALSAGSTLLSARANNQVVKARNSATAGEAARQDALQRQSIANFDNTSAGFTRQAQDEKLANTAEARGADLTANIQPAAAVSAIPLAGSTPGVVKENLGKQLGDAVGRGKDFAKRLGTLGAFGETTFGNNQALARGAQDVSRLANFSAGSSRILPLELNAANQKGAGTRQLADLTGAFGGVAGLAGALGAGGGAFGPGTRFGAPGRP